ncbi:MAG: DUF1801 domain-containing protein [Nonlabens sp.]
MNPAEEYIDNLPEPYRQIAVELQVLIEQQFPAASLKFKWRLPFYYLDDKTMFCFINYRKEFIELGMPYGANLTVHKDQLIGGENRKMLRSLRYQNPTDINAQILYDILAGLYLLRTG